jgi:hypothetical protein
LKVGRAGQKFSYNLVGENAMHLFGDPTFPKKNIAGGSLLMVVAAFEFGTFPQRTIQSGGVRVDYLGRYSHPVPCAPLTIVPSQFPLYRSIA